VFRCCNLRGKTTSKESYEILQPNTTNPLWYVEELTQWEIRTSKWISPYDFPVLIAEYVRKNNLLPKNELDSDLSPLQQIRNFMGDKGRRTQALQGYTSLFRGHMTLKRNLEEARAKGLLYGIDLGRSVMRENRQAYKERGEAFPGNVKATAKQDTLLAAARENGKLYGMDKSLATKQDKTLGWYIDEAGVKRQTWKKAGKKKNSNAHLYVHILTGRHKDSYRKMGYIIRPSDQNLFLPDGITYYRPRLKRQA